MAQYRHSPLARGVVEQPSCESGLGAPDRNLLLLVSCDNPKTPIEFLDRCTQATSSYLR